VTTPFNGGLFPDPSRDSGIFTQQGKYVKYKTALVASSLLKWR
jgi:hypothetical protein